MITPAPRWLIVCLLLISNRAFPQADTIPLFSFGLMTDVQYCDCEPTGTRHYRSSLRKLTEAVQTFNQKKVAFVTHLGDFIDRDFQSYDTLNAIVKQLKSPLYHVLGNHDFSVKEDEIKKAPAALQLKNRYYSFARNQWRFIVLDGNDLSIYGNTKSSKTYAKAVEQLESLKARKAPNAQPWNGGLGEKQLGWLKKQLASAARKDEKVLILCHMPLMPEAGMHNLWNDQEVRTLIEGYPNVRAYLNGHVHEPSYFLHKGTHYITFKGMVEKEESGFAIIHVYRDHLKIEGYASEVDRVLK